MDTSIHRALNDKLYDKRKIGALEYVSPPPFSFPLSPCSCSSLRTPCEISRTCQLNMRLACRLERVIRELVASKDYARVQAILEQLCNEFAYAVHQPHARNGGLIGLAAAAIALGSVRFSPPSAGS